MIAEQKEELDRSSDRSDFPRGITKAHARVPWTMPQLRQHSGKDDRPHCGRVLSTARARSCARGLFRLCSRTRTLSWQREDWAASAPRCRRPADCPDRSGTISERIARFQPIEVYSQRSAVGPKRTLVMSCRDHDLGTRIRVAQKLVQANAPKTMRLSPVSVKTAFHKSPPTLPECMG